MTQAHHNAPAPDELIELARDAGAVLKRSGLRLALAESCTGGLVAAAITSIPGSSAWFERGFVTYSNDAKTEMLGVATDLIDRHGAVSIPVAEAMARGALAHSHADIACAITGIAGPGGGSAAKPVGMVCFALADRRDGVHPEVWQFPGDRRQVRDQAGCHALATLRAWLARGG